MSVPLDALIEIVDTGSEYQQKAEAVLSVGKSVLDVDNGHVTLIDPAYDHWEILATTDDEDGRFPPDLTLDLCETYCRRVLERGGPIALHDAPNQGWADDVAYRRHGLDTYLGVPITVSGHPYGTLCFVSDDPRAEPFSRQERQFVEFLSNLLERELALLEREMAFENSVRLVEIYSRLLRHNLRNDVNIIQGHTRALLAQRAERVGEQTTDPNGEQTTHPNSEQTTHPNADAWVDPDAIDRAINRILAISEKAHNLKEIAQTDGEIQEIVLERVVADEVGRIAHEYPAATLDIEQHGDTTLLGFPTLRLAVRELLENAAEHAGDAPSVTVSLRSTATEVTATFVDDGPGMSELDQYVLKGRRETPLTHGSGIGLWISYWIVNAHGGVIDVESTAAGTAIEIRVPRVPVQRRLIAESDFFREHW